jgi:hypothetical protein
MSLNDFQRVFLLKQAAYSIVNLYIDILDRDTNGALKAQVVDYELIPAGVLMQQDFTQIGAHFGNDGIMLPLPEGRQPVGE